MYFSKLISFIRKIQIVTIKFNLIHEKKIKGMATLCENPLNNSITNAK